MQSLILFLQLLNLLSLMLEIIWLTIALQDFCSQKVLVLRTALFRTFEVLSTALPIPQPLAPSPPPPPSQQRVLYHPSFPMHNLCWIIITQGIARLPPSERASFAPHLRGSHFATLANSLIADDPAPILIKHGIALAAPEQRKVAYLATLPELVVTPPEDGNRRPQRGERGGKKVRIQGGRLVPPKRVGKLGMERRRGEKRGG